MLEVVVQFLTFRLKLQQFLLLSLARILGVAVTDGGQDRVFVDQSHDVLHGLLHLSAA